MNGKALLFLATLVASASADGHCNETNICMTVDYHASETGYYNLDRGDYEDTSGSSPTITVKVGQTVVFDQSDSSNWYHAVGFAFAPDGAHGDVWGADENPEVEGPDQLKYLIDGAETTCVDKGDTGLDCYEPDFFLPLDVWGEKVYSAELTITEELANESSGGVIYYFCHIHSKMSGKIQIVNDDGTPYDSGSDELDLYEPITHDEFDTTCGTTATADYQEGGSRDCGISFFPGSQDSQYEQCLQAIDCQMHWDMYSETSEQNGDKIANFMQQMIPHHQNAVNMAKLLLKHVDQEELDSVEDLEAILYGIINIQNFQIHQFRNYLNPKNKYLDGSMVVPPHIELKAAETTVSGSGAAGFTTGLVAAFISTVAYSLF